MARIVIPGKPEKTVLVSRFVNDELVEESKMWYIDAVDYMNYSTGRFVVVGNGLLVHIEDDFFSAKEVSLKIRNSYSKKEVSYNNLWPEEALTAFFDRFFFGTFWPYEVEELDFKNEIRIELYCCKKNSEEPELYLWKEVKPKIQESYEVWVGDYACEKFLRGFDCGTEAHNFAKSLDREKDAWGYKRAYIIIREYYKGVLVNYHVEGDYKTIGVRSDFEQKYRDIFIEYGFSHGYVVFDGKEKKICVRFKDYPAESFDFRNYDRSCDEYYSVVIGNYEPSETNGYKEVVFSPETPKQTIIDYLNELIVLAWEGEP